MPNIATPTDAEPMTASTKVRLRNRCSGMIGSVAARSTNTVATSARAAPPTMAAVCQDAQANWSPANVTHRSSSATATAMSVAPA